MGNAVVIQDAATTVTSSIPSFLAAAGVNIRERRHLNDMLIREVEACRGGAQVFFKPTSGSLVDVMHQEQQLALAVARPLALPCTACCRPGSRLVGVPTSFDERSYDVDALAKLAASCLAAASAAAMPGPTRHEREDASPWRGLFCVEARFRGARAAELWALDAHKLHHAISSGAAVEEQQFVLTARGEVAPPQQWMSPLAQRHGAVWWFILPQATGDPFSSSLHASLTEATQACLLRPPPPTPSWTIEDVPPEEVSRLDAELRASSYELPPGFFFDGCNYINVDGRISKDHPNLAQHLVEYVAVRNTEAEAKNAVLREVPL